MSPAGPRLALVRQAVLDVRREPDHRSELTNQLLLGEAVRIGAGRGPGGWVRLAGQADGYRGWARDWGLEPVHAAGLARWCSAARHRVAVPVTHLEPDAEAGGARGPLPWMSRVERVGSARTGIAVVRLPDGRMGRVAAGALRPLSARPPALDERVRSLLGAPYLWGGRTVLGIDCSGLTQLVLAERGVALPRDADPQWRAVRHLAPHEPLRPADLVFFASTRRGRMEHVGVYLGRGRYLHARAVVRINSLDPSNPLFDNELAGQLIGFGRAG